MEKYVAVGRQIRALMGELTPLVEPLSIDEAFMDLGGTEKLHRAPPALTLARFARRVEDRRSASRSRSACPSTSSWPKSPPISTNRAAFP